MRYIKTLPLIVLLALATVTLSAKMPERGNKNKQTAKTFERAVDKKADKNNKSAADTLYKQTAEKSNKKVEQSVQTKPLTQTPIESQAAPKADSTVKPGGDSFPVAKALAVGDSIKRRKKVRIDRGIEKITFIPRGSIFFGGTLGYTSLTSDDFKFLIFNDLSAKAYLMNGRVMVGYAFKDDVAVGVSFEYSRTFAGIDKLNIDLSEDLGLSINDFSSIQQVYTGTAFLRTYINIGSSKRFGMYNDLKVSFGGGEGKILNGKGDALKGTYQKISNVGLLLSPGISVFATDFMTVEASIGILGLQYSRTEQISNQVYVGSFETVNASFKLNLFSINMGVAFYF
ncbi:MAG: hypothetical protein RSA94_02655 [Mucinivorans sp.]